MFIEQTGRKIFSPRINDVNIYFHIINNSSMQEIKVRGAKTHNLKNIDLTIPRDKLVVITGLSGSGKSSLAFDTLYAEGQRRYVESLSAYARQFLSMMEKPDVEHIEGLSPAISIEQKATSHNPRSTVGTITEIYDYLRLLYARVGTPNCPNHPHIQLKAQSISQIVDKILEHDGEKAILLAPIVINKKGEFVDLFKKQLANGYLRAYVDGELIELNNPPKLKKQLKHNISIVVDRLKVKPEAKQRLAESLEHIVLLTEGLVHVQIADKTEVFSTKYSCIECDFSAPKLEPRSFSFNNPIGACSSCNGLGIDQYFDPNKLIHDPTLTLAQGAIKGWDSRKFFYFSMLKSLAKNLDFDINTPFCDLEQDIQDAILHGTSHEIQFEYINSSGSVYKKTGCFEGVIPNIERRFKETDSNLVREELNKLLSSRPCTSCNGERLNALARNVTIAGTKLPEIVNMSIADAAAYFQNLNLSGNEKDIAEKINKEIIDRISFLMNVGLNYLTLSRSADTLSGGEAQRIRLASQIGSGLVGVMYILDEPSIGLHQRDNDRLIQTLTRLRDLGNSVIVVEHDEDAIMAADYLVDMGPGAGVHGGEVVASGTPKAVMQNPNSITGKYLTGKNQIQIPEKTVPFDEKRFIKVEGAQKNNLKNLSVVFPLGLFTCITGVSGSGKSSLINDTLYPLAKERFMPQAKKAQTSATLTVSEELTNVINITQSPIGRTPRSNPATYTGLFTHIRDLFANTEEARARGYKTGRFSFNVKGGRCETCQGDGMIKVEMHFLSDIYVTCESCKGKRYNRETLEIYFKGKNIYEVLNMTIEDALDYFSAIPQIATKLQTLADVGLSYITLGQSAVTLSGGEAQRIKLAKELSKRSTGNTLYILDEPTTGLHFHDINQLMKVLIRLRDKGNTIVVIEHNLDVIKCADWAIDIGPEGGANGGQVVAFGTPKQISENVNSHTGKYLRKYFTTSA